MLGSDEGDWGCQIEKTVMKEIDCENDRPQRGREGKEWVEAENTEEKKTEVGTGREAERETQRERENCCRCVLKNLCC